MSEQIIGSFITQCKVNFFNKITPANKTLWDTEGYKSIVAISKSYFKAGKKDEFMKYFQDGQYFIQLWAAHLLIEFGNPSEIEMMSALRIIINYTENPLAPEVAIQEKNWLNEYDPNWEKFTSSI
jgi:hypothetical protein